MITSCDAVILAGSLNNGPLKDESSELFEALIPIAGRRMIEYVAGALLGCSKVEKVVVVGPVNPLTSILNHARLEIIEAGDDLLGNVARGIRHLMHEHEVYLRPLLVVTSDVPFLTVEAIEDFLVLCGDASHDIYYPVIPREVVESRFPATRRTYVRLREGQFTGGNLILINPQVFLQRMEKGKMLVEARKSPFRLARLLGFCFLGRFLLRQVSLQEAERKVSRLLGVRGRVVVSKYPEVGVDVDKPADLLLARHLLAGKGGNKYL